MSEQITEYVRSPGATEHQLRQELETTALLYIAASNPRINIAEVTRDREASGQSWVAKRAHIDCSGAS